MYFQQKINVHFIFVGNSINCRTLKIISSPDKRRVNKSEKHAPI